MTTLLSLGLCDRYVASPPATTAAVYAIAFSPDSRRLAHGTADAKIYLWDMMAQVALPTITVHDGGVLTLAFSPDGRCLTSGSNDQTLAFSCKVRPDTLDTLTHISSLPPQRPESSNWIRFAQ